MLPRSWKRPALGAAVLGALLLAGGFLLAWSGVISIAASRGHWAITNQMLAFSMRRSVQRHARAVEVPALDSPALLHLGAEHYEGGCEPCHGAPGASFNPITRALVPPPPSLAAEVETWKTRELFWIVKNGVKYTSMPAWPAQDRDDEVWAVVAFLLRLPHLDASSYRRLLRHNTPREPQLPDEDAKLIIAAGSARGDLVACARCHGLRGEGGGAGAFPRLNILGAEYLYDSLRRYASGERSSGIMQPVAAELDDDQMRELANYFAGMQDGGALQFTRPADEVLQHGRDIAERGVDQVALCTPCHGPERPLPHPLYPPLAGQHSAYLQQQLRLWRRRAARSGNIHIMAAAVRGITDEQIEAVSGYYASLAPESAASGAQ